MSVLPSPENLKNTEIVKDVRRLRERRCCNAQLLVFLYNLTAKMRNCNTQNEKNAF